MDSERIARQIFTGENSIYNPPTEIYEFNSRKLITAVNTGFKKGLSEVEYMFGDKKLIANLRQNIYFFSGAKTFQETLLMTKALVKDGVPLQFNEFKKEVEQINDTFNKTYLKTEYDTTIASAQCASAWSRFEKEKKTLELLRYSTIGDACPICAPLDGITAPVDSPIWKKVAPVNHFNCLCLLEQHSSEDERPTESDKMKTTVDSVVEKMDDTFKNNPGITGQVFTKKHPYFSVPKKYKDLAKRNFNLRVPKDDN